jgi:hypothetical protein
MTHPFKPIDLNHIKTVSLSKRKSKVTADDFAKPLKKGSSIKNFLDSLPDILAGKDIRAVI